MGFKINFIPRNNFYSTYSVASIHTETEESGSANIALAHICRQQPLSLANPGDFLDSQILLLFLVLPSLLVFWQQNQIKGFKRNMRYRIPAYVRGFSFLFRCA